MRRRPAAGGMSGSTTGLLFMVFGVLIGLSGAILSLLLRWPGLQHASPFVQTAARAHIPLLTFFAAVPASLGGLAMSLLPGQVGAHRSAFPILDKLALWLTGAALAVLITGSFVPGVVAPGVSAIILASATVLTAANMVATVLIKRSIAYSDLPVSAWTTLIAAVLVVCAAPVIAAAFTVSLLHGIAPEMALSGLFWPVLCMLLVLMLGSTTDIFQAASRRLEPGFRAVGVLLAGETFVLFMAWAFCIENRLPFVLPAGMVDAMFLVMVMPFELLWGLTLLRQAGGLWPIRLPVLFASGFAVMLPIGLLAGLSGTGGHEAVSLSILFALFAGFFQLTAASGRGAIAVWTAQAQFWLLVGGSITVLFPVPSFLQALGAAMCSLSVGLFAIHLVAALSHPQGAFAAVGKPGLTLRTGGRSS